MRSLALSLIPARWTASAQAQGQVCIIHISSAIFIFLEPAKQHKLTSEDMSAKSGAKDWREGIVAFSRDSSNLPGNGIMFHTLNILDGPSECGAGLLSWKHLGSITKYNPPIMLPFRWTAVKGRCPDLTHYCTLSPLQKVSTDVSERPGSLLALPHERPSVVLCACVCARVCICLISGLGFTARLHTGGGKLWCFFCLLILYVLNNVCSKK